MILNWEGPIKAESYLDKSNPDDRCGVYLWICRSKDDEWIEYVGKATGSPSLGRRQQEHIANILGLRATIPADFRDSKKKWVPNQYPNNKADLIDLDKHMELLNEAKSYMNSISIYVAAIPIELLQHLKQIERNLLYDLSPRGTINGTKTKPEHPLKITHKTAKWATPSILTQIQDRTNHRLVKSGDTILI